MIENTKHICLECDKTVEVFLHKESGRVMCGTCIRKHYPPNMTLLRFSQGSFKKLWNVEVGIYETINDVEDLSWCGWFLRSTQETIYRRNPTIKATIYFMEYLGDFKCGRCVDYPYFEDMSSTSCEAAACKNVCKQKLPKDKIQPVGCLSRYREWLKI